MELEPYVASIQEGIVTAAAAATDETRQAAGRLATAIEPTARLALMHALADLAAEVTAVLSDRVVEVGLDGPDLQIRVAGHEAEPDAEPLSESGDVSRITLRLPEELKGRADQAAADQGISLNAWLSRAVVEALRPGARPAPAARMDASGHRLRGWVQG